MRLPLLIKTTDRRPIHPGPLSVNALGLFRVEGRM